VSVSFHATVTRRYGETIERQDWTKALPLICLTILSVPGFAGAQDSPVQVPPFDTVPPLVTVLPFAQRGDSVLFTFPVLINEQTIVGPAATLRMLYVKTDSGGKGHHSGGGWSGGFSGGMGGGPPPGGEPGGGGDPPLENLFSRKDKTLPPEQQPPWTTVSEFQSGISKYSSLDMHLLFVDPTQKPRNNGGPGAGAPPPADKEKEKEKTSDDDKKVPQGPPPIDEAISFPDGLVLGEKDKAVVILAVEKSSRAASAGIKAGDAITKVGGKPTDGSLATFLKNYTATKKTADVTLKPSYILTVKTGVASERDIAVPMPPSIHGSILDQ
jgi:hypothetical protein